MKFTARSSYTYVPKYGGNQGLPKNEQMSFEIVRPKPEERAELFHLDVERDVSLRDKDAKSTPMTFKRRPEVGRILRNHIGKIVNVVAVYDDGSEKAVTSGAAFADSPLFGVGALVDELVLEVISDKLSEDEKKISESASSSPTQDGRGRSGTGSTTANASSSPSDSSGGKSSEIT